MEMNRLCDQVRRGVENIGTVGHRLTLKESLISLRNSVGNTLGS